MKNYTQAPQDLLKIYRVRLFLNEKKRIQIKMSINEFLDQDHLLGFFDPDPEPFNFLTVQEITSEPQ